VKELKESTKQTLKTHKSLESKLKKGVFEVLFVECLQPVGHVCHDVDILVPIVKQKHIPNWKAT